MGDPEVISGHYRRLRRLFLLLLSLLFSQAFLLQLTALGKDPQQWGYSVSLGSPEP